MKTSHLWVGAGLSFIPFFVTQTVSLHQISRNNLYAGIKLATTVTSSGVYMNNFVASLALIITFSVAVQASESCKNLDGGSGEFHNCAMTGVAAKGEDISGLQVYCDTPDNDPSAAVEGYVDRSKLISKLADFRLKVVLEGEDAPRLVANLKSQESPTMLINLWALDLGDICKPGERPGLKCGSFEDKAAAIDLLNKSTVGLSQKNIAELKQGTFERKRIQEIYILFSLQSSDLTGCRVTK